MFEIKKWEDYDTIVCPDGQVIDMVKLLDDQQRARTALVHLEPTFGAFVNKLTPIYTFKVATQATDGKHVFINPQFTYNLNLTEKVFVLAHEIMHCLLNHLRRGKGHDQQRSNIAADYECNITLVEMGLLKFDTIKNLGAYIDNKYKNFGYEAIYDDCSQSDPNNQNNKNQAKNAQNNQSNEKGEGSGNGNNQQKYSDEYIKGWNKAMEDYKKGKLKI